MDTQKWISHFPANTALNDQLPLPETPCTLPDAMRVPLAASLAVFQLGEQGSGSRLRRYARAVAPLENYRGYQRAVDLFVAEEQSHSALLARVVGRLGGALLEQQWTHSIFRRLRGWINLEFAIQVLVTAELVAEVYYGLLYLAVPDEGVRRMSHKILRDEMKHLQFQREFLAERVADFSPLARALWLAQFRVVHAVTVAVVAWDHRRCLRALGWSPREFRARAARARARFLARLMAMITPCCGSPCAGTPMSARRQTPRSTPVPAPRTPCATHAARS